MTYAIGRRGCETLRMNGSDGLALAGWGNFYAPSGYTDGTVIYTRPAYVESIIVERPVLITDAGSFGILLFNLSDRLVAPGPPGSGETTVTLHLTGATTQGSYEIPIHGDFDLGLLVRFENFGAGSPGRIAIVYSPFARRRYAQAR